MVEELNMNSVVVIILMVLRQVIGDQYCMPLLPRGSRVASRNNPDYLSFSIKSTDFRMGLFRDIVEKSKFDNYLISPFGLWSSLILARVGAQGSTAAELDHLLNINYNDGQCWLFKQHFMDERLDLLRMGNSNNSIRMNSIIYRNVFLPMNPSVLNTMLGLEFDSLILKDVNKSTDTINQWAEIKTNHTIKRIIKENDVGSSSTGMILVNIITFNGFWASGFTNTTSRYTFIVNPKRHVKVDMMTVEGYFSVGYDRYLNSIAVDLPYSGHEITMFVLLPNTTVDDLIPKLTPKAINDFYYSLNNQFVTIKMPKFNVTRTTNVTDYLETHGIRNMFSASTANFTTFTGGPRAHIQSIPHKVHIEINEAGTNVQGRPHVNSNSAEFDIKYNEYIINRPFVFFIRRKKYDTVYFGGVIRRPNKLVRRAKTTLRNRRQL